MGDTRVLGNSLFFPFDKIVDILSSYRVVVDIRLVRCVLLIYTLSAGYRTSTC
jgi:hypothetical protein